MFRCEGVACCLLCSRSLVPILGLACLLLVASSLRALLACLLFVSRARAQMMRPRLYVTPGAQWVTHVSCVAVSSHARPNSERGCVDVRPSVGRSKSAHVVSCVGSISLTISHTYTLSPPPPPYSTKYKEIHLPQSIETSILRIRSCHRSRARPSHFALPSPSP